MFEMAAEASKALSSWPIANAFFMIVIAFLSLMAWRRGEKDRKSNSIEYPIYMVSGPVHDAMGSVHELLAQTKLTTEIIRRVIEVAADNSKEIRNQTQILEEIRNAIELRPPPTKGR